MTKNRAFIAFAIVALLATGITLATAADPSVTGTIASKTAGTLVVDTDDGQQTFILTAESEIPEALTPGSEVTIEYRIDDEGRKVATLVAHPAERDPMAAPSRTATTAGASQPEPPSTLPATGSLLPLLGLLGLLAVAGAFALRLTR